MCLNLLNYNMPLVPFLDKPYFATYAFNMSGGINNKWFRNELAKDLCKTGNAYAQLNNEVPDKPSSLIYLPYLCRTLTAGRALLSVDNRTFELGAEQRLTLRRSEQEILLVLPHNISFYETLHSKMMWDVDVRN